MTDRDILPDDVRPSHYALAIRDLNFSDWTYKGSVVVKARIQRPTREIVLNAHQLKLRSATLKTPEGELASDDVVYDEPRHRATIRLPAEVAATDDATLTIEFEGVMNNSLCGFYRSRYKPAVTPVPEGVPRDADWHYMFSTQFEACDARRAFPCWDEPNLKASFDFEIEVPADLVALSNMPVKAEREDGAAAGRKIVSFERTPIMSTYLLAWAFGDFEHIEQMTERKYDGRQLPVRVYTTRGLKEQGRWALQHAAPIIDYFSEAFGIDYPLPKADLLCTHEFAAGAMENWGLVTYRTTAVLFDEKTSDASYRNRVAYVVAHELAHQWFGNLVTMDWWDELWLNEGFATWVGWHAVDRLHPDWDVWSQFVREGMGSAFSLDGIRSSHPIHVPVRDALEVDQIFDHISYLKGCSAIRMLADHVGVETFLRGVGRYLDAHKYGNAKTEALWAALSEASGKPIADLIGPWIAKIGYPVVTVAEKPAGQLTVRQNRFLTSGDVRPEEDETVWSIPLALRGKKGVEGVWKKLLQQREDTIPDVDDEFYKLNSGSPGFYRVNYPPERLAKLGTQLDRLGTEDRIATIGSAADLAYAGYASTTALLSFLEGFGGETNQLVWSAALGAVGRVKSIFGGDDAVREALERFVLKLIGGAVERVGLEFKDDEDYLTTMLRKQLVGSAAANGHPEVKKELLSHFDAWVADPEANPIHPNLRLATYSTAVRTDPARAIPILKKEWFTTRSPDGKSIILSALGTARDAELVRSQLLPFLFDSSPPAAPEESVPSADMSGFALSLAANRHARPLLWETLQARFAEAVEKLGHSIMIDTFIERSLGDFAETKTADEIDAFFKDKDSRGYDRTLRNLQDKIRARAAYKSRDEKAVREWLVERYGQ